MPLTKEQFLAMQEGDVFYYYNRNTYNIDFESARTVTVTVERRDGELIGIGVNPPYPGNIRIPIDEATADQLVDYPLPLLFATSAELQDAHFARMNEGADAIRQKDASSILNDLFNGWYGECNQSNADKLAMKERIHELFGVTITR